MRKEKKDYRVYLHDILSAIDRINEYTAGGSEAFFADGKTQDAAIRQFSVVGEASAKLPQAMRANHKEIPWKDIVGMRNIIIHDYSEIDLQTIWDTVEKGLPPLKRAIQAMLREVNP